jgi:hypothetical protein
MWLSGWFISPVSYLVGSVFDLQSKDWLFRPEFFCGFPHSVVANTGIVL